MKRYSVGYVNLDFEGVEKGYMFENDDDQYLLEGAKDYLMAIGFRGKAKLKLLDLHTNKIYYRIANIS